MTPAASPRRPRDLPSREECLAILRDHGCSEELIRHSETVATVALALADRCGANRALVEVGALLHDIGRARSHGPDHAVIGAGMLRELGLRRSLCLIVERHIGGGIPKEEAGALGLPLRDYLPQTWEEKIVCHADNLVEGAHRVPAAENVAAYVRAGLLGPARRITALHRELTGQLGADPDTL